MEDLRLSRRARRITAAVTVVLLGGLSMTMIVLADYNNWLGAWSVAAVFAGAVYTLGTPAFRIQNTAPGKVELNTILGLLKADLTKGYTVKRGLFGKSVIVLKTTKKRYRINGALGDAATIQAWLDAVPRA